MRAVGLMGFAAVIAACAAQTPPPYGEVVTMTAEEAATREGYPPPGTVWRLDERDLQALSPAPFVEPPPPPRFPPPRPNDPARQYYGPPYYAPSLFWGSGFYYWGR